MPRRAVVPAIGLLLVAVVLVGALATPAGAGTSAPQQDAPTVSVPHIIPQPNSGKKPEVEGDPGSTAQSLVFWGMCGALLFIAGLVVLESRRKLRARADAEAAAADQAGADPTRSSTLSEPVADTSAKTPESSARQ